MIGAKAIVICGVCGPKTEDSRGRATTTAAIHDLVGDLRNHGATSRQSEVVAIIVLPGPML